LLIIVNNELIYLTDNENNEAEKFKDHIHESLIMTFTQVNEHVTFECSKDGVSSKLKLHTFERKKLQTFLFKFASLFFGY
jgi:hypothetical protein